VPPILVMVFVFLMTHEAGNTFSLRGIFFGAGF
jgi:cytochrome c oxidase subunit IV